MSRVPPSRIISPNPGTGTPVAGNTTVHVPTARVFSRAFQPGAFQAGGSSTALFASADLPALVMQAIVTPGEHVDDGVIVHAAAVPWFEIVEIVQRDPEAMYQIDWRKWEEIVAGAWSEWGKRFDSEVIITPRSGDKGRDIIVTLRGYGSVRYFDQVKAFKPGNRVERDDVTAMIGTLNTHGNVSKGIITTTSDFAPGVLADEGIQRLMPHRLELRPRAALLEWLSAVAAARGKS